MCDEIQCFTSSDCFYFCFRTLAIPPSTIASILQSVQIEGESGPRHVLIWRPNSSSEILFASAIATRLGPKDSDSLGCESIFEKVSIVTEESQFV